MSSTNNPASALTVWRFSDGRAGHDTQSKGLINSLAQFIDCQSCDISVPSITSLLRSCFFKKFPPGAALPSPDLLIGAGHATHLPLLCARRARGGKIVVLMKPSLPTSLFDYCFIPEHDEPTRRKNVFLTQGALNSVPRSDSLDASRGLILIGGVSRHFHWDNEALMRQLQAILDNTNKPWAITDSPRTPAETRQEVRSLKSANVDYVPFDACEQGWLQTALQTAGTVWVSQDSISMIYEALSAGGAVGVLELQPRGDRRLTKAAQGLAKQGNLILFSSWDKDSELPTNNNVLQESTRCAKLLIEKLCIR